MKIISFTFAIVLSALSTLIGATSPRLLWQKQFPSGIDSVDMDSTGQRICLAVAPTIYLGREKLGHGTKPLASTVTGMVYCFDNNGNLLWEYKNEQKGKLVEYGKISISNYGEHMICTETTRDINKVLNDSSEAYAQQEQNKLCFDDKGHLVWTFKSVGYSDFSANGKFVLITPDTDESGKALGEFVLLTIDGNVKWRIAVGEMVPSYSMNYDASRVAIGDSLYDNNGGLLWKISRGSFVKISDDGMLGEINVRDPDSQKLLEVKVVNLETKLTVWDWLVASGHKYNPPQMLMEKFKNKLIVNDPNSKFYQKDSHLITEAGKYIFIPKFRFSSDPGTGSEKRISELSLFSLNGAELWHITLPGEDDYHDPIKSFDGKKFLVYSKRNVSLYENIIGLK